MACFSSLLAHTLLCNQSVHTKQKTQGDLNKKNASWQETKKRQKTKEASRYEKSRISNEPRSRGDFYGISFQIYPVHSGLS